MFIHMDKMTNEIVIDVAFINKRLKEKTKILY